MSGHVQEGFRISFKPRFVAYHNCLDRTELFPIEWFSILAKPSFLLTKDLVIAIDDKRSSEPVTLLPLLVETELKSSQGRLLQAITMRCVYS
ncbi:hypothetical protein T03_985 [Trichinella britovi]|uniref:Uncharacterized protein n=1 Tax=Trichinella britovi TaxID=45882 RepID=A0A0V1CKU9_TRIBR|nr:hypothetical protein T03_985 [Trichinella britovi]